MKIPKFVDNPSSNAQEPDAVRHSFDGDGWLYADKGNGSDWLKRALDYPNAEPLYTATLTAQEAVPESKIVERKFYHSQWKLTDLLAARHGGLVTDEGEAWSYRYSHKDGTGGRYDLMFRREHVAHPPQPSETVAEAQIDAIAAARAEIERLKADIENLTASLAGEVTESEKLRAERDSYKKHLQSCIKGNNNLKEKIQKAEAECDEERENAVIWANAYQTVSKECVKAEARYTKACQTIEMFAQRAEKAEAEYRRKNQT